MLTYTLDLLTAQRFGQPTVGYGCETRDLCNVCVYKAMQFVTAVCDFLKCLVMQRTTGFSKFFHKQYQGGSYGS